LPVEPRSRATTETGRHLPSLCAERRLGGVEIQEVNAATPTGFWPVVLKAPSFLMRILLGSLFVFAGATTVYDPGAFAIRSRKFADVVVRSGRGARARRTTRELPRWTGFQSVALCCCLARSERRARAAWTISARIPISSSLLRAAISGFGSFLSCNSSVRLATRALLRCRAHFVEMGSLPA
jgi:hypothetical protein